MRAEFYRDLHEFNSHIAEAVSVLDRMLTLEQISAEEVRRFALHFEELRSSANTYLTAIFHDQEALESGRLSRERREREMADDPLHAGWKTEGKKRGTRS